MLRQDIDFDHASLQVLLKRYTDKGRGLSASFANWFLENIYRLDASDADDALVDSSNDKGVDGIYVDHNFFEIHIIQSKIRNDYNKTVGDVALKELEGTRIQFQNKESIQKILDGGANEELKKLIVREELIEFVELGYKVKAIYITNVNPDANGLEYVDINPLVEIWGRQKIIEHVVDFDASEKVDGDFTFDVSYAPPLKMTAGEAKIFVFAASASELVNLSGISDTTLFSQNVRYSLGRTAVNKGIAESISRQAEHKLFPLYHNGIIILCEGVEEIAGDKIRISGYTVVNGAQSITTLYENQKKISDDLRIFVRVISLKDIDLAKKITRNSNNQNPTKPRDLKSSDPLMARLQAEFAKEKLPYHFEIKRGEKRPENLPVTISNDMAGRMLLAFDLGEPESAHQIYKVFEEKYSEIFGRKEVDAYRIAFLWEVMEVIAARSENIKNRPMAAYALTRYFLLYVVSAILGEGAWSRPIIQNPKISYKADGWKYVLNRIDDLMKSMVVDLNWEISQKEKNEGSAFDYKSALKSPNEIEKLMVELVKSFEKEVGKGAAKSFDVA